MTLHPLSTLHGGKYSIEKVLGQGGFGITYLAEQPLLRRKVAIKEFFMKEFCNRDSENSQVSLGTEGSRLTVTRFREKFVKEARNLASLRHPNIVSVIDIFEENGTAYYVMEYAENGSLADLLKAEGPLSEQKAISYILQVGNALDYIHGKNMTHLDVKPANIMLDKDNNAILIDFGLSKQYDETGSQTSTTPVGISEGYAPMEQYRQGGVGEFSPQTDIYSLGATLFKLLTGTTPPSASDVCEDGIPFHELQRFCVSQNTMNVIAMAMRPRKRERIQTVNEFMNMLCHGAPTNGEETLYNGGYANGYGNTMGASGEETLYSGNGLTSGNDNTGNDEATYYGTNNQNNSGLQQNYYEDSNKGGNKFVLIGFIVGAVLAVIVLILVVNGMHSSGSSSSSSNSYTPVDQVTDSVEYYDTDTTSINGGNYGYVPADGYNYDNGEALGPATEDESYYDEEPYSDGYYDAEDDGYDEEYDESDYSDYSEEYD